MLVRSSHARSGGAAETINPEWRDRIRTAPWGLKKWQHDRPNRPLVLVFGSSRTEYGVSPADMDFPDEPGSPLVYNFGYSGAYPLGMWLQLSRALDDGLRPKAVLVELAYAHVRCDGPAEEQFPKWGPRFSESDLRRFAPYTKDESVFRRDLAAARRNPWAARRVPLVSDLLPDWQLNTIRSDHDRWEGMDRYGRTFLRPESVTKESRQRLWDSVRVNAPGALAPACGAASDRAFDMVAACRERGVAVPSSGHWNARVPRTHPGGARQPRRVPHARPDLGTPVFRRQSICPGILPDGFHLFPTALRISGGWPTTT